MATAPHTVVCERSRLECRLALVDLLIAIAEESICDRRQAMDVAGHAGDALAEAVTALAVVESSMTLRSAERDRLLVALAELPPSGCGGVAGSG